MPRRKPPVDPETGLTPEQEQFCVGIIQGKSQAASYRASHPKSANWQDATVWRKASLLAKQEAVRTRIVGLQAELKAASKYTVQRCMAELEEAVQIAREKRDSKAISAAVALRARINGLMVEERKNDRPPLSEAADDLLDAAITSAQRELEGDRPPTIQ